MGVNALNLEWNIVVIYSIGIVMNRRTFIQNSIHVSISEGETGFRHGNLFIHNYKKDILTINDTITFQTSSLVQDTY